MKSAGFRSNVGVVEVDGQPVTVTLTLVSAAGEVVGSMELGLPAGGHRQVNDVFAATGAAALDLARCKVEVAGDGRVIAYASVVDNMSGDPIYIPATPGL